MVGRQFSVICFRQARFGSPATDVAVVGVRMCVLKLYV
jgi:hypothetical protein